MFRSPLCECGHLMFDHSHYELEDESPFHRICLCMMCVDCNGFKEVEYVESDIKNDTWDRLNGPIHRLPDMESN